MSRLKLSKLSEFLSSSGSEFQTVGPALWNARQPYVLSRQRVRGKGRVYIGQAVNGRIPWHSCGVSLAIWDHTVLPATRYKWTHPALTPAIQVGTRFTYPGRMEGWVDLVDLIGPRPGVEPATFRSRVQCSTTAPCTKTKINWTALQSQLNDSEQQYRLL